MVVAAAAEEVGVVAALLPQPRPQLQAEVLRLAVPVLLAAPAAPVQLLLPLSDPLQPPLQLRALVQQRY